MKNKITLKDKLLQTNCFNDNEWLDKYIDLVFQNKCDTPIKYVTQQHHIFPVHLSHMLNEEVDNSPNNLINLKFKDHLLAHLYLLYAAKDEQEIIRCVHTVQLMMSNDRLGKYKKNLYSNNLIDILQELDKDSNFCRSAFDEWRLNNPEKYAKSQSRPGEKNGMYGKHHTEEARRKMRLNYSYHTTDEVKRKMTERFSKSRWYNNGIIEKFTIEPPDGFVLGRLPGTNSRGNNASSKPTAVYDINKNLLGIFDCSIDAAEFVGLKSIKGYVKGFEKPYKGYYFVFIQRS